MATTGTLSTSTSRSTAPRSDRGLFRGGGDLHKEVKARVKAELTPERVRRGRRAIAVKGVVLVAWTVASYLALMFVSSAVWLSVLLAISLGLAVAGVAFSIGHDANHGALSRSKRVNRLLGFSYDLLGASSYVWRVKHNHAHHTFTNVEGADNDIEQMPLARLAPEQPLRWYHRGQHVYMWIGYGLFTVRHHLVGDLRGVTGGRFGEITPIARPRGADLVGFVAGKLGFVAWTLVIPMLFHPWWQVLGVFLIASWVLGLTLAAVFQLAHCVDEADFATLEELREGPERDWAAHQVETTVDFATGSRFLTWYLGGLNFQIEHHLFPKVCHVHYPLIAPIVRQACEEHGVRHFTQPTLRSALASHVRWLHRMGRPEPATPTV